jgi:putative inorganic carbon (hco3(-)) transporter
MPVRALILLSAIVVSLPFCFMSPFYGVLVWTVVAFLNPQSYLWGAAESFPWALAIAIPTLIGLPLFCRSWLKNLATGKCLLLVALWVWFTLTSLNSSHDALMMEHAQDTWTQWKFVSKIVLMTFATVAILNTFEKLRTLVVVIAGCFGFYVLKALPFIITTGGALRLYGPDKTMIADNNDFGLALNMTLPLYFFLARSESNRWLKRLYVFLSVATIPAIFCTYSRGALVGLIATGGLMFLMSKHRLVLIPVIAIALILALFFAPAAWQERMDPTRPDAIDGSAQSRLNSWAFAWNLASDYPIAGGGFATFTPELFARYAPNVVDIHGPHSVYFQILAEHGFVGIGLFCLLVGSCFITTFRLKRKAKRFGDASVATYADMFRFSLIGFMVSGIFLGRAYFDYFYTIIACVIILENVANEKWLRVEMKTTEEVEEEPVRESVMAPEAEVAL